MPEFDKLTPPTGHIVQVGQDGDVVTPDDPVVPYIEGDGIGPEIWEATREVLDAAVEAAYGGKRRVAWFEIFAGHAAIEKYGEGHVLPEDTFAAIRHFKVAIKGPLTTPVGGGIRSCNVALRQRLDLYANVRPVQFIPGLPSPLKNPERVDLVIFRENTEDVYAGIEWADGTPEAREIIELINTKWMPGCGLSDAAAIGIKPITQRASERLVRAAIQFALDHGRKSVTLVHKGNIMKFTEGGFLTWGKELAEREFGDRVITLEECEAAHFGQVPAGKVLVKERIADAMFQDLILHPEEHDVVATTNLNGDYLSDAAAALIGGLGFAAGANLGDGLALFEAVHGTAPDIACQDVANPSSLILTGRELLRYLGWDEAAALVWEAIRSVVGKGYVTADVACWLPNVVPLSTQEFKNALLAEIRNPGS
ncbi:MAG: NADP-dependent isocitrate dehydrogenase [Candidatus Lernaella stagnicola]|nr:NADP-dependent isocitrate dehydrogenase [Candidatus Lernaella stagnicola]